MTNTKMSDEMMGQVNGGSAAEEITESGTIIERVKSGYTVRLNSGEEVLAKYDGVQELAPGMPVDVRFMDGIWVLMIK